jgi:TolB protein
MTRPLGLALLLATIAAGPAAGQDTTRAVLQLLYNNPKVRPGLVVLPAPGLDSVRAIVERDLDYSDRFELIPLPAVMESGDSAGINFAPYRAMNAALAVELQPLPGATGVTVRLHDVATGQVRNQGSALLELDGTGDGRLLIHRLADEIVRWATGTPGIAATRLLYVADNRIWRVDSDGYGARPLTPGGQIAYSPAWRPDGHQFVYTELGEGQARVVFRSAGGGDRTEFPTPHATMNITPAFSPDGRWLAFSSRVDRAYGLHQADARNRCCTQRLTTGRFAENLSPTYSPDGRRIGFVSSRAGSPQIYVMSTDGTNQELLVPFDYGITGASFAPEWSPDGLQVAFHREVGGGYQVMVYDLTSERVRQVTSEGRNEDPSWAPDGRHLVFVSTRSGRRQLHVIDLETARVRVLPTPGSAQLPSWSRLLGGTT